MLVNEGDLHVLLRRTSTSTIPSPIASKVAALALHHTTRERLAGDVLSGGGSVVYSAFTPEPVARCLTAVSTLALAQRGIARGIAVAIMA